MKKRIRILAALCGAALFSFINPIHAQDGNLLGAEPIWHLSPGDRDYLTFAEEGVSAGYSEKGLAYNPVTHRLYLVHYDRSIGISSMSIHILDADTGDDLGTLSVAGTQGGTEPIRKIVVSDDGVIYAGNFTTDAPTNPYKLYRWQDEISDPELVWTGDPSGGIADVYRGYGGNLAIRGGGNTTEILVAPDYWQQVTETHVTALLTTSDGGQTFTPRFIQTEPTTRYGLGTAFGEGDTFWATRAGQPLREFDFDGNLLREFGGGVVASLLSPIGVDLEKNILAGVVSKKLYLYDLATLDPENYTAPIGIRDFPTQNANVEGSGAIAFSENRIYALDTNNGIIAYYYGPPLPILPGDIYWTNATEIRTAEIDGSNPRTVVAGLARPIGIDFDPVAGVMYWAEDANSAIGAGKIMAANIDGTDIRELLIERTTPQFLRYNPKDGRLYWAEYSTGLYSMATDGTDLRHLIDIAAGSTAGVSLDLENDIVYLGSAAGQLYQYEIGTTYPSTPAPLTTLASATYGIAYDDSKNRIWATSFSGNYLYYKDLVALDSIDQITGLDAPLGIALTEDNSQLVWVERTGGDVRIASTGETTFTTLVTGEDSPFGIMVRPSAPTQTDFASWIATFDLAEGDIGATDDPDGDGISNLLEFALNLDPTAASRDGLPQPQTITESGNDYLVLEINKNTQAVSIDLVVESSGDLQTWNSGDGHTVILEETESILRVRDALPIDSNARRFLRLRAVEQ